jgi:hypothetical protein
MDALTQYIFHNYYGLMTFHEIVAYRSIHAGQKADHASSLATQGMLQRHRVSSAPEVRTLLNDGPEQFMINVRDRIVTTPS